MPLLAHDFYGRLYTATKSSIKTADAEKQLSSKDLQNADLSNDKELQVQGALLQSLSVFTVSTDGALALLAGPSSQDEEHIALFVVNLALSRPSRSRASNAVASSKAGAVHPSLFQNRPGLGILQITWHPGSNAHFAVLTTDNCWRLYCVSNLTLPEQTFELQTGSGRRLGLSFVDDESSGADRQAVAFAFGCAHAWERFTVFFVCSDASVFALCPVAPFHAPVSLSALERLLDASQPQSGSAYQSNNQAWLSQALPRPENGLSSRNTSRANSALQGEEASSSLLNGMLTVQPHALDDHVPALGGPLQALSSDDGETSLKLAAGDQAIAILTQRYSDSCSAVVVGTAAGKVHSYIVAGEIEPAWAQNPPACRTQGRQLVATQSEAPIVASHQDILIARDRLDLQLSQQPSQALQLFGSTAGAGPSLQLMSDPAAPERVFAVHPQGAFAITLAWLPVLATYLKVATSEAEGLPDLMPATLEHLWHPSHQGGSLLSAAPGGSHLTGSALMVLDSYGRSRCLRPSRPSNADQRPEEASTSGQEAGVSRETVAMFGNVLQGPPNLKPPSQPAGPTGAGNPEGQQLLTESIQHLREKHVVFAHMAHHDLTHNIELLERMAAEQQEQCRHMQGQLAQLQQTQSSLDEEVQAASQFQENLMARLQLLAQLHWGLPHRLTLAEQRLRDTELPQLESECSTLQVQLKALSLRATTLEQPANGLAGQQRSPALHRSPVPPQQFGKMRRALETQEEGILQCQQQLALLEAATASF